MPLGIVLDFRFVYCVPHHVDKVISHGFYHLLPIEAHVSFGETHRSHNEPAFPGVRAFPVAAQSRSSHGVIDIYQDVIIAPAISGHMVVCRYHPTSPEPNDYQQQPLRSADIAGINEHEYRIIVGRMAPLCLASAPTGERIRAIS